MRASRLIVLLMAAASFDAGVAAAQSRRVPIHTVPLVVAEDSVSAVTTFQKLSEAMRAGDSVAFVSLFAPDAMVMKPGGELIPFAEFRKVSLGNTLEMMKGFNIDKDSVTRVSVSRGTGWVGSSTNLSGRLDGSLVHLYMESLALMRLTPDGWRVVVLNSTSR